MTQPTRRVATAGPPARSRALTDQRQRASDRARRAGDLRHRVVGRAVAPATGPLGRAGRACRDPRFGRGANDPADRAHAPGPLWARARVVHRDGPRGMTSERARWHSRHALPMGTGGAQGEQPE